MNEKEVLQLIVALANAAPTLGADAIALIKELTTLITGNPQATAANIKAAIDAELAQASADDASVEG